MGNNTEYRIFKILTTENDKIIEEELIARKSVMNEAHEYLSNTVKHSSDDMAHKKYYYSKFIKVTSEESQETILVFDENFGRMYVGPKTAKGILEDLD